jgi:23S rRNA (cytidine2498-2'-O)-methyltransferase
LPTAGPATDFLFAACQVGAERALKQEFARRWPDTHLAFSRPGFVTFKATVGSRPSLEADDPPVFARTWGDSLVSIRGASPVELAAEASQHIARQKFDRLHVWQRDTAKVGWRGFEPGPTELSRSYESLIHDALGRLGCALPGADDPTKIGDEVLDVMIVEPTQWHLGRHRAMSVAGCWAGGVPDIALPNYAVSRAYLKMEEAIRWSGFRMRKGERCAEIGCAPGGASQALLDRGLKVMGIDPAEVSPALLEHPNFVHVRKRGSEVRRREFRDVNWLMADINVAPQYTLDTVEAIVTHSSVKVQGLLLTLKLLDWHLAGEVPTYLEGIASWGFKKSMARQLAHNRQEICIAAWPDTRPG